MVIKQLAINKKTFYHRLYENIFHKVCGFIITRL